jgi:hypothetical protein
VPKHDGLCRHTAHGRIEAYFARMLAFDFELAVKEWRRACIAQIWYWTREQYAALGELESPLSPIRRRGPKGRSFSAHIRWAGAKLRPLREQTGTRNKVYLQSDAIRVLE